MTIVFLVYNRREELRTSLHQMLVESDYDPLRIEVIVVDNASSDGSSAMVREEFPQVQLISREQNVGVSGWNEGFAAARGDFVLALDDDCYLPTDGLSRAVVAALEHQADLVSFKVVNSYDPGRVFTDDYRTGLFSFWGCAVLMRREVLRVLDGYDPEIFVWANELEFMLRFFDHGFRHLHLPSVVAQHMKEVPAEGGSWIVERPYRANARHFAYIASKLLRPSDAAEALLALLVRCVLDGLRENPKALKAVPDTVSGFVRGLRHRQPVANSELSRIYRRNFHSFASPWWYSRAPRDLLRGLPSEIWARGLARDPSEVGRYAQYFDKRARFYPQTPATLQF